MSSSSPQYPQTGKGVTNILAFNYPSRHHRLGMLHDTLELEQLVVALARSLGDTQLTMQRLKPETIIISLRTGNDYGHPHDEALALYDVAGAQVFRTDLRDTIIVKASENGEYKLFVTAGESGS